MPEYDIVLRHGLDALEPARVGERAVSHLLVPLV